MSTTYGYATKLFLESEFQPKGNKQTKNANSQQNLEDFWARTDSEIKSFKYYTKKDKIIFGQNCHQEDRSLPLKRPYSLSMLSLL